MKVDDKVKDFGDEHENKIELRLAYSKTYEVEKKNRRVLQFKSQFCQKLKHLQNMGRCNQTLSKLENWLDDDINNLYGLNKEA